jgi:hypothetical protein
MTAQLPDAVRSLLRFVRHDIAGRVHVLMATIELASPDGGVSAGDAGDAIGLLRDVERSWRVELRRLDELLTDEPSPFPVGAHRISEILGLTVTPGTYQCDPEALANAVSRGRRSIGRASLYAHTTRAELSAEGLVVELRAGTCGQEPHSPLYEAIPGDGDAAFCEAEARLAGVAVSAGRDADGVIIRFVIPHHAAG